MVKAIIDISPRANTVLNIVKAKHSLKHKSQAIERIAEEYAVHLLGIDFGDEHTTRSVR